MTQEEKDLLFKDLCGRIMYGVKCTVYEDTSVHTLSGVLPNYVYKELYFRELDWKECDGFADVQYCKPYLFPMSSMTDEQKYDFYCRFIENDCDFDDFKEFYLDGGMWHKLLTSLDDIEAIIDWFHKNHFDYRGLIDNELAIDATGLNIY
jgi:hypothetical protein